MCRALLCTMRLHLVNLLADLAAPFCAGNTLSMQIVGRVVSWCHGCSHTSHAPLCGMRLRLVYLLAELAMLFSANDVLSTQIVGEVVLWLLLPCELRVHIVPAVCDAIAFGCGFGLGRRAGVRDF
jgi:hypothetical protein